MSDIYNLRTVRGRGKELNVHFSKEDKEVDYSGFSEKFRNLIEAYISTDRKMMENDERISILEHLIVGRGLK